MYDFNYHKPSSSNAAASAVAGADDGKFLAGGQTLLPTMKQRLAMPSDLVDLAGCDLSGVRVDGDHGQQFSCRSLRLRDAALVRAHAASIPHAYREQC